MIDLNDAMTQEEIAEIDFSDKTGISDLQALLSDYNKLRENEALAKKNYETLHTHREHMEEMLYGLMENAGLQSVKTDDGTFYQRTDIYCSVRKEVQEEAFEWLRKQELGDIIQPTVNSRTLSAIMKERIEAGGDIPEFVNVTTKNRIGIRK